MLTHWPCSGSARLPDLARDAARSIRAMGKDWKKELSIALGGGYGAERRLESLRHVETLIDAADPQRPQFSAA